MTEHLNYDVAQKGDNNKPTKAASQLTICTEIKLKEQIEENILDGGARTKALIALVTIKLNTTKF